MYSILRRNAIVSPEEDEDEPAPVAIPSSDGRVSLRA
jgi:hypothetical protein